MAPSWLLAPAALAKRLRGSPMPLLALDVSPSRVGLAICANPALGLATVRPFGAITRRTEPQTRAQLAAACAETGARAFVVGWPLEWPSGAAGSQCALVFRFLAQMAASDGARRGVVGAHRPVVLWDERFSTTTARAAMADEDRARARARGRAAPRGRSPWRRPGGEAREDAVAAAVILQDFLSAVDDAPTAAPDPSERAPGIEV